VVASDIICEPPDEGGAESIKDQGTDVDHPVIFSQEQGGTQ